jgi:hypothetical protein
MQVTIQSVTPKKSGVGKTGKPWTISEVVTDQGTFDTFDALAVGATVDVEIEKNPNPQYNDKLKKSGGTNNYQNTKNAEVNNKIIEQNSAKDERISWLACQKSAAIFYQQSSRTDEQLMELASKLFNQATKGSDSLPF